MRRKALILATVGSAAFAAPAQAQSSLAIVSPLPCYLSGQQVTFSGAGFTPGGAVQIQLGKQDLGQTPADATGAIGNVITLGGMRGVKAHAITATDVTNPALKATTTFMGTSNYVTAKPKNARAGVKRTLRGYGFLAGPKVYMHVRGNGYGADKRVAKPKGACGTFATRKVIVPASAGTGVYRVQFDARKKYSKKTRPRFVAQMTVSVTAARASWARLPDVAF